jgi:hypothetical protein
MKRLPLWLHCWLLSQVLIIATAPKRKRGQKHIAQNLLLGPKNLATILILFKFNVVLNLCLILNETQAGIRQEY